MVMIMMMTLYENIIETRVEGWIGIASVHVTDSKVTDLGVKSL
jgi:hypothetical protein